MEEQVKRYKIHDAGILEHDFKQQFDKSYGTFRDNLISVLNGYITIDILKFDDWLHAKFGDYEDLDKSMRDVIIENFGEEACAMIERLI